MPFIIEIEADTKISMKKPKIIIKNKYSTMFIKDSSKNWKDRWMPDNHTSSNCKIEK